MAVAKKTTATKSVKKVAETATEASFEANESAFAFADQAREGYETFLKQFNVNAEEFSGKTQEFVEAARASFEQTQERLRDAGAEAVETAKQDVSEAVEFAHELASAKTIADAFEIQRDYWTNFFDTRVERTRAMTQQAFDMTRETLEPMNKSFATPFASTPFAMPGFEKFFPFAAK